MEFPRQEFNLLLLCVMSGTSKNSIARLCHARMALCDVQGLGIQALMVNKSSSALQALRKLLISLRAWQHRGFRGLLADFNSLLKAQSIQIYVPAPPCAKICTSGSASASAMTACRNPCTVNLQNYEAKLGYEGLFRSKEGRACNLTCPSTR